jgi:hypothetical protein
VVSTDTSLTRLPQAIGVRPVVAATLSGFRGLALAGNGADPQSGSLIYEQAMAAIRARRTAGILERQAGELMTIMKA